MTLFKKNKKIELVVHGMHCNHCVMRVEKALGSVGGVRSAEVSLEKGEAIVAMDPAQEPTVEALIGAVVEAGYQAEPKE